ncbi:DUF2798 domain-containing protein [Rhodoferax saidenbachensis]|uniref:DUF2798 domain-containing protein n=1 Tax=Rhodoferax saidenbachensis TaxID=1484693 RepID=A0A1P8KER6_9BURK|nr:DUF2798 domain-containing protein [Rhodoferax saidenbachensis]APW44530.1 DUF2798 domain-containing protein [Rhodoferax saidenbachensis]
MRKLFPHILILPTVALLLSAFMTWANVGLGDAFPATWARNFVASLVVLPLILMGIGHLEHVAAVLLPRLAPFWRKLLVSLLTACVIESVLALVIALINSPWDATLARFWWLAFSRSLPIGLVIGLFMGFYMKPKIDRMKARAAAAA